MLSHSLLYLQMNYFLLLCIQKIHVRYNMGKYINILLLKLLQLHYILSDSYMSLFLCIYMYILNISLIICNIKEPITISKELNKKILNRLKKTTLKLY